MGSTLTALLALVSCGGEAGAGESPPLECRPRRGIHLHTPLFHIVGRMEPTAGGDHWPRGATDGNAVFGHDGMVHVMHQTPNRTSHTPAQPTQGYWASWGHVVSDDLAHFRRVQNALDPGFSSSYDWHGITQRFEPTIYRPLFARFAPSFHRSFATLGFLAPRRRERAKNGVKWAKFGGETPRNSGDLKALGAQTATATAPSPSCRALPSTAA